MLKGISNLANLGSIFKQAQQMGSRMEGISDELKTKRAVGSAGGGMVEVEVNGLGEVLKVTIEPELFEKQDKEMIEDLLPAAINQAGTKAKQLHAEAMQAVTEDMNIPGLGDAMAQFSGGQMPNTTDPTDKTSS